MAKPERTRHSPQLAAHTAGGQGLVTNGSDKLVRREQSRVNAFLERLVGVDPCADNPTRD